MIHDLALILGVAAVVTLLFKRLNQPLVLGYLVAGFLVGPHSFTLTDSTQSENIKLWSDLGVIFLLFAMGLEFSFKKLMRVGATAGLTAVFEISVMLGLGFLAGKLMGWSFMDCVFLGGIISISSTSVIYRTLEELGLKNKKFVGLVFGVLVIEDLLAVLLMVLLSTVALTREFSGMDMLTSFLKLIFFLLLWFVAGVFLLPSFLKKSQKLLTEETVLVIAVGLCLGMVMFATQVGFSAALGAFVTGSLLAETIEAERIHHLVRPVKDLFSAVFFVSVGMLLDPQAIATHFGVVLVLVAVVMIGKTLSVTTGALLAGQGLKPALQTGMTLSQIGEFSFIIATLGLGFHVISETLYPIAVAVSVVTTFTTPYMMKSSKYVFVGVEKILPARWAHLLEGYSRASGALAENHEWSGLLKGYVTKIVLNSVVAIAIFLFASHWLLTWLMERQMEEGVAKLIGLTLTLVAGAPFLWAVAFGRPENFDMLGDPEDKEMRGPRYVFLVTRIMITVGLMGVMVAQFVPWYWALAITAWMVVVVGFVMYRYLEKIYAWFESGFLTNFNDSARHRAPPGKPKSMLAPWDAHITEFVIPAEAAYVGEPLHHLSIREKYGVTIALIERGRKKIAAPGRNECLMPFDRLAVIGTDEQLEKFREFIGYEQTDPFLLEQNSVFSLEKVELKPASVYLQKNIRESGLREATSGLVVGIEREGRRLLNPDSSEVLCVGDILWIVGDRDKILQLNQT
jgi:CPA2 family monovalent cation:H+ antiporter-2